MTLKFFGDMQKKMQSQSYGESHMWVVGEGKASTQIGLMESTGRGLHLSVDVTNIHYMPIMCQVHCSALGILK